MTRTIDGARIEPGDIVEITGHAVGDAPRKAEVLEVIGEGEHEHYRVRWEDGHESVFFPGSDAHFHRARR
ncbi:MAG: DUF1918 domain-containing protein [Gaiellales bacterium]